MLIVGYLNESKHSIGRKYCAGNNLLHIKACPHFVLNAYWSIEVMMNELKETACKKLTCSAQKYIHRLKQCGANSFVLPGSNQFCHQMWFKDWRNLDQTTKIESFKSSHYLGSQQQTANRWCGWTHQNWSSQSPCRVPWCRPAAHWQHWTGQGRSLSSFPKFRRRICEMTRTTRLISNVMEGGSEVSHDDVCKLILKVWAHQERQRQTGPDR